MKINDTVLSVMNQIDARIRRGRTPKYAPYRVGHWYDRDGHTHQVRVAGMKFKDYLRKFNAKTASGCNAQAVIFDDVVVKWLVNDASELIHESAGSDSDEALYRKAEQVGLSQYIAETVKFGRFTVQERITPMYDVDDSFFLEHQLFDLYTQLVKVAVTLGIGDLHSENWGFRGDDYTTPVIFDLSGSVDYAKYETAHDVVDRVGCSTYGYNSPERDALTTWLETHIGM